MKPDHIITCVYCGQTYPENTPTHGADVAVLTQHISQCEKHPMRAVIRERDDCLALLGARKMELDGYVAKLAQNVKEICELKAQLAQLRQEYDRYTEQQTDLTQREHQRHVEIKERLEQQLAQAQAAFAHARDSIGLFLASITPDSDNYVGGIHRLGLESCLEVDCGLNSTTAGRSLLAKLETAITALDKLSKLGNEPLPGNSEGNRIAQKALDSIRT